jgi:hypothetical protein
MYWTAAAVLQPDPDAKIPHEVGSDPTFADAYRCANGHTSKRCPLCGSYDTAAWSDGKAVRHYHVICAACGNDSVIQA